MAVAAAYAVVYTGVGQADVEARAVRHPPPVLLIPGHRHLLLVGELGSRLVVEGLAGQLSKCHSYQLSSLLRKSCVMEPGPDLEEQRQTDSQSSSFQILFWGGQGGLG